MRRPEFIARQGRHPHGWLGGIVARVMALETAADNEEAIKMLRIQARDHILDIGTGHGRSLGVMAALADKGLVIGVDTSDVMLKIATRRNKSLIQAGRVRVHKSSSDALPLAPLSLDKAMAIHTLYFWNPAEPHLNAIARVLKPGGRFVFGFGPAEDAALVAKFPRTVYTLRTTAATKALLVDAGFQIIGTQRRDASGDSMVWLLAEKI